MREEWNLYTITVVFKAGGSNNKFINTDKPNSIKWESEYRTRVLQKIRKAIEPNQKHQGTAIPYEDFFYYEFDHASIFKNTNSRKPHHIHGLLPIRKSQATRFWSLDIDDLKPRLKADLDSIQSVQSVLVEPIRDGKTIDWVKYAAKGKEI